MSTSERQLLSVLSLIIYIRSRVEEPVNMEGLLGKFRALLGSLMCFLSSVSLRNTVSPSPSLASVALLRWCSAEFISS